MPTKPGPAVRHSSRARPEILAVKDSAGVLVTGHPGQELGGVISSPARRLLRTPFRGRAPDSDGRLTRASAADSEEVTKNGKVAGVIRS